MTTDPGRFYATTPVPPPPKQPAGCGKLVLIGCAIVAALGAIAAVVIVVVVFGAIRKSDIYSEARNRAVADPRVIAALGQPIRTGWLVTGSINLKDRSGSAKIGFPISGPKGDAHVDAVATLEESHWNYSVLTVRPDGGPVIDVLRP